MTATNHDGHTVDHDGQTMTAKTMTSTEMVNDGHMPDHDGQTMMAANHDDQSNDLP